MPAQRASRAVALVVVTLGLLGALPAGADEAPALDDTAYPYGPGADDLATMACGEAMVWGQRLRDQLRLVDARRAFQRCAAMECLDVVRRRCESWASEVDGAIPRLRVQYINISPEERAFARVSVDGRVRPEALTDEAMLVDPGRHRIEVELADGRVAVREVQLAPGQVRTVEARFGAPTRETPDSAPVPPPAPLPVTEAAPLEAPLEIPALDPGVDPGLVMAGVGFGVGGAAAIASVVTGLVAIDRQDRAATTCALRACSDDEIASGRRIADASTGTLVVALVGTAVGVIGLLVADLGEERSAGWPLRLRF